MTLDAHPPTSAGGPPHLVLLPGLHGTDDLWRPLLAVMPDDWPRTVVRYPPDRVIDEGEYSEIIEQAFPAAGEVVLVGESFSGALAVAVAARQRKRVAGLVLSAGYVRPPWPGWSCSAMGWVARVAMRPMMTVRGWLPDRLADATVGRAAQDALRNVRPAVLASRLKMVARTDVRDALKHCAIPLLYLQASGDIVVRPRNLRLIQQVRPDVRVERFDCSHLILQRRPREAWRAIEGFAREALTRGGW